MTQYTLEHLQLRMVILGLIIFAWWFAKRKSDARSIRWSEVLTLSVLMIIAAVSSQYLRNWHRFQPEWWNIGWSIFIFLVTTMIFVKNRQNTRDDLIAMQNYTIKRYLSLEKQKSEDKSLSEGQPVKAALLKLSKLLWF